MRRLTRPAAEPTVAAAGSACRERRHLGLAHPEEMPDDPLEAPRGIDAMRTFVDERREGVEVALRAEPDNLSPPRREVEVADVAPLALPRELAEPYVAVAVWPTAHALEERSQPTDRVTREVVGSLSYELVQGLLYRPVPPLAWRSREIDVPHRRGCPAPRGFSAAAPV